MAGLGFGLGVPFKNGIGGPPAPTYATWNPADKNAEAVLSGGNLIVDSISPGSWSNVRCTIGKQTGVWYTEHVFTGANLIIGVATSSAAMSNNAYCGGDAEGYGYYSATGGLLHSAGQVAAYSVYASGSRVGIVLDAGAKTIKYRINGGTFTTPYDISALTGDLFITVAVNAVGDVCTSNFGASAFTDAVPSGANSGLYS